MSLARWSMSLVGIAGLLAAVLAAATIWLLFTEPVTVADAVTEGDVTPLVRELAGFSTRRSGTSCATCTSEDPRGIRGGAARAPAAGNGSARIRPAS